jgi:hypothetical protein
MFFDDEMEVRVLYCTLRPLEAALIMGKSNLLSFLNGVSCVISCPFVVVIAPCIAHFPLSYRVAP